MRVSFVSGGALASGLCILLAACGGGGGGSTVAGGTAIAAPVAAEPSPSVNWLSTAVPATTTCPKDADLANQVDCVLATADNFRSDRKGGVWFRYNNTLHAMDGQRRVTATSVKFSSSYVSSFDTDNAGVVWMVNADRQLSTIGTDGAVKVLSPAGNQVDPVVDGPLQTANLGYVRDLAANGGVAYVVRYPKTQSENYTFARIYKDTKGVLQVETLPKPPSDDTQPIAVAADSQGRFWGIFDTHRNVVRPTVATTTFNGQYELISWDAAQGWKSLSAKSYQGSGMDFGRTSVDLYLTGLTPLKDGSVIITGASAGLLYKVDPAGNWTTWFDRQAKSSLRLGQDGSVDDIPVSSADNVVEMPDGSLWFVDQLERRLRRIASGRIDTIAGRPAVTSPTVYTNKSQPIGTDASGHVLLTNGTTSEGAAVALFKRSANGATTALVGAGTYTATSCSSTYHMTYPPCLEKPQTSRKFLGVLPDGRAFGVDSENAFGQVILADASGGLSQLSTVAGWPAGPYEVGYTNGIAPGINASLNLIDATADANYIYLLVYRSSLKANAIANQNGYSIYRVSIKDGTTTIVAGKAMPSTGAPRDLEGAAVNFTGLALATNGDIWLASANKLWVLPQTGALRVAAGDAANNVSASSADGTGTTARFRSVTRIRTLSDGRLLVVDELAHAVRAMDSTGRVTTLVGTLNQSGDPSGALTGLLKNPFDAFAVGRDIYITARDDARLVLATKALP